MASKNRRDKEKKATISTTAALLFTAPSKKQLAQLTFDAAKAGNVEAQYHYGHSCLRGDDTVAKDEKLAMELLNSAAEGGHARAQILVREIYRTGCGGIKQDSNKVIVSFIKAFKGGELEAAYQIGQMYELGAPDLPINKKMAKSWYEKAATTIPEAIFRFAVLCHADGEIDRAVQLLKQLADKGSVDAIAFLGHFYLGGEGIPHLPKDEKEAERCFEKVRQMKDAAAPPKAANAALMLGLIYLRRYSGLDSAPAQIEAQNKALTYFKAAATEGDKDGVLWGNLMKAATEGDAIVAFMIGMIYAGGNGTYQDTTIAVNWFQKAALKRHRGAALMLGAFHNKRNEAAIAKRYFRLYALESDEPDGFEWIANMVWYEDPLLADHLIIGAPITTASGALDAKEIETSPFERTLYLLLKRLAEVRQFMKAQGTEEYTENVHGIYEALEKMFAQLETSAPKDLVVSDLKTSIRQIETDLEKLEQIKSGWGKKLATVVAESATAGASVTGSPTAGASVAELSAAGSITSGGALSEEPEEDETELLLGPKIVTFDPFFAPPIKSADKDALPPQIVALRRELIRLQIALGESGRFNEQEPTVENLTDRREGLLALMGRICRRIAENCKDTAQLGKFAAIYDPAFQQAGNYIWHDDVLAVPISTVSEASVREVRDIHTAAEELYRYLDHKIKGLAESKEGKAPEVTSLEKCNSKFLRKIIQKDAWKNFDPQAQVDHFKKTQASISRRKSNVLANEKCLRLLGMTGIACFQLKKADPGRYSHERLGYFFERIKTISKYIRHPDEKTSEDLMGLGQGVLRRSRTFLSGQDTAAEENVSATPTERKTAGGIGTVVAGIVTDKGPVLRGSPVHADPRPHVVSARQHTGNASLRSRLGH